MSVFVSAGDGLLRLGLTDFCQHSVLVHFIFFNQKGLQSRTELYTLQLILKVSFFIVVIIVIIIFFSLPYFFFFFFLGKVSWVLNMYFNQLIHRVFFFGIMYAVMNTVF